MEIIEKIDTICLKVRDIKKAKEWYKEKLNFKVSYDGGHYIVFQIGNSSVPLTLEQGESKNSTTYPIFYTSRIEEAHEQLKSKGITVDEVQKDGVNTFFTFYDLDGNLLQLCYWHD
ncbi:VOC family protein [Alkalihalobacillus sp. LMS39]|uniref:VOC family protein n=1 Tax=Alkalihalobacillus sp. LMS39 TaxID=2924032 RepID=UPI001FB26205|nr:VOC family protein [Alkalihalobacillus sp. LMS39]UOE96193.1 VOC family protein [Alkalihalobacillus sp. LMS39]